MASETSQCTIHKTVERVRDNLVEISHYLQKDKQITTKMEEKHQCMLKKKREAAVDEYLKSLDEDDVTVKDVQPSSDEGSQTSFADEVLNAVGLRNYTTTSDLAETAARHQAEAEQRAAVIRRFQNRFRQIESGGSHRTMGFKVKSNHRSRSSDPYHHHHQKLKRSQSLKTEADLQRQMQYNLGILSHIGRPTSLRRRRTHGEIHPGKFRTTNEEQVYLEPCTEVDGLTEAPVAHPRNCQDVPFPSGRVERPSSPELDDLFNQFANRRSNSQIQLKQQDTNLQRSRRFSMSAEDLLDVFSDFANRKSGTQLNQLTTAESGHNLKEFVVGEETEEESCVEAQDQLQIKSTAKYPPELSEFLSNTGNWDRILKDTPKMRRSVPFDGMFTRSSPFTAYKPPPYKQVQEEAINCTQVSSVSQPLHLNQLDTSTDQTKSPTTNFNYDFASKCKTWEKETAISSQMKSNNNKVLTQTYLPSHLCPKINASTQTQYIHRTFNEKLSCRLDDIGRHVSDLGKRPVKPASHLPPCTSTNLFKVKKSSSRLSLPAPGEYRYAGDSQYNKIFDHFTQRQCYSTSTTGVTYIPSAVEPELDTPSKLSFKQRLANFETNCVEFVRNLKLDTERRLENSAYQTCIETTKVEQHKSFEGNQTDAYETCVADETKDECTVIEIPNVAGNYDWNESVQKEDVRAASPKSNVTWEDEQMAAKMNNTWASKLDGGWTDEKSQDTWDEQQKSDDWDPTSSEWSEKPTSDSTTLKNVSSKADEAVKSCSSSSSEQTHAYVTAMIDESSRDNLTKSSTTTDPGSVSTGLSLEAQQHIKLLKNDGDRLKTSTPVHQSGVLSIHKTEPLAKKSLRVDSPDNLNESFSSQGFEPSQEGEEDASDQLAAKLFSSQEELKRATSPLLSQQSKADINNNNSTLQVSVIDKCNSTPEFGLESNMSFRDSAYSCSSTDKSGPESASKTLYTSAVEDVKKDPLTEGIRQLSNALVGEVLVTEAQLMDEDGDDDVFEERYDTTQNPVSYFREGDYNISSSDKQELTQDDSWGGNKQDDTSVWGESSRGSEHIIKHRLNHAATAASMTLCSADDDGDLPDVDEEYADDDEEEDDQQHHPTGGSSSSSW